MHARLFDLAELRQIFDRRNGALMSTRWDGTESRVEQEHVVLEGGPADVPRQWPQRSDSADVGRVKVPHRGGYEHYHATGEQIQEDGRAIPVYRWTQRTRVAE
jgi:hypothetical protein